LEKYCHAPWKARTIFGWLEEGAPIWNTHAMGAGKIEEKIGGGGTPPSLQVNQVSWWS